MSVAILVVLAAWLSLPKIDVGRYLVEGKPPRFQADTLASRRVFKPPRPQAAARANEENAGLVIL